jgi:hypothetical protein
MLLQGCIVPVRFSGYIPSGPGNAEGGYCVSGIKDTLRVKADAGVEITVRAGVNKQNETIMLDVDLVVPEGTTMQLLSPDLLLESPEWTEARVLRVYEITAPGPRDFSAMSELPGAAESMGYFSFWFKKSQSGVTSVPKVTTFKLQLPPLRINGKTVRIAPIIFEAYSKLGVYTCVQ